MTRLDLPIAAGLAVSPLAWGEAFATVGDRSVRHSTMPVHVGQLHVLGEDVYPIICIEDE